MNLSIDIFMKCIAYLSFDDVVSICNTNKKLYSYCTKYNTHWKALINNTFSSVDNYHDKLKQTRVKLKLDKSVYNYLVYTNLVKILDPITQLMIYYRQGDMNSFDNAKFNNENRVTALFLLGKLNLLNKQTIPRSNLNSILINMATRGNVKGVKYFQQLGADINADNDNPLRLASKNGHLEVVKYLIQNGADIHAADDRALRSASGRGHLNVVKYLVENGANIHALNDYAITLASGDGHLEVMKYLIENGADIHAVDDRALQLASQNGHLHVVNYLKSLP